MVRIALLDECEESEAIRRLLESAGYEVTAVHEATTNGARVELQVNREPASQDGLARERERHSGITELAPGPVSTAVERLGRSRLRQMDSLARLSGSIAHDFNNILSVISICTDELGEATRSSDSGEACLDDLRQAVERGASLTRDLLAFSRRTSVDPKLVDFHELLASSSRMIERIVGDDIEVHASPEAHDARVRIDPAQWSRVFVNLASNARTAMPQGGTLTLNTRDLVIDPAERGRDKPKGRYIELSVSDTGCGMPEDVAAHVFEPFFTTKDFGTATGLGLSVVFGVVEQSGGWIEVTSAVGTGTTFRIYIPEAAARATPRAGPSRDEPARTASPRGSSVRSAEAHATTASSGHRASARPARPAEE
jgi:signal transduction histidine kinase